MIMGYINALETDTSSNKPNDLIISINDDIKSLEHSVDKIIDNRNMDDIERVKKQITRLGNIFTYGEGLKSEIEENEMLSKWEQQILKILRALMKSSSSLELIHS